MGKLPLRLQDLMLPLTPHRSKTQSVTKPQHHLPGQRVLLQPLHSGVSSLSRVSGLQVVSSEVRMMNCLIATANRTATVNYSPTLTQIPLPPIKRELTRQLPLPQPATMS